MKIKNIEIENFKGIKHQFIEFKDGFNLIIGNNGFGKTSILDAIATSLGGFVSGIEGVTGRHIQQNEVRIETKLLGDASYNIEYKVPVIIKTTADLHGVDYTWLRKKNSYKASRSTIEPREITKAAGALLKKDDSILPVISYQGAGRMWSERRETKKYNKSGLSRAQGYMDSLWPKANTKNFVTWAQKMEQISFQEDKKITEYEAVKKAVAEFMGEMNNTNVTRVFYNRKEEELVYEENGVKIPIDLLSSGYQSLIWLAFDIAYRMAILNPELREDIIKETTGIVLIDELDVHLHPQWQWRVIQALEKTFPKIQFIATTHAPIVLSSTKDALIIRLDKDNEVSYDDTSYAVPIDSVLKVYQNVENVPEEVANQLSTLNEALEGEDIEKAEKLLSQLKNDLGENNPFVVSANMEIEFEKMELD